MAYADLSPADIETRVRRTQKPPQKAKRTARCPTQAEIWPQHRFRGLVRKRRTLQATIRAAHKAAGGILLAAAKAAGAAIAGGLLDGRPRQRQLTRAEALLVALDASRAARQVVGRIDVSGASDAACWAIARDDGKGGALLEVFYRHGRDVLADLARVLDGLVRELGWKVARPFQSLGDRIRRAPKMESGVWVASWGLSAPA